MPGNTSKSMVPLLAVVFIGTLGFSIVLPFLVFIVTLFGGNGFVYGVMGATYSAFQLVGAPVLGRWSDRIGRRRVLMVSQAGTAIAWGLFLVAIAIPATILVEVSAPVVGTFTLTVPLLVLFAARALDGLTGGNVSVANAYVADITPEADRSRNFGRMAVAQNLGFIAGPAIAGVLASGAWGNFGPISAALLISVAALLAIYYFLPETTTCHYIDQHNPKGVRRMLGQDMRDCHEDRSAGRPGLSDLAKLPVVRRLLTVQFLVYLAFNFFYVAFPLHAVSSLEWNVGGVGAFLSYLSVLMVLVQGPVLSYLSKRVTDQHLVLSGGILLAVGFSFFATDNTAVLVAGAAVLALGNGLMWPSLVSILSSSVADNQQGAVHGISGSTGAVASMIGLVGGGVLFGLVSTMIFQLAAVVAAAAWLQFVLMRRNPITTDHSRAAT